MLRPVASRTRASRRFPAVDQGKAEECQAELENGRDPCAGSKEFRPTAEQPYQDQQQYACSKQTQLESIHGHPYDNARNIATGFRQDVAGIVCD